MKNFLLYIIPLVLFASCNISEIQNDGVDVSLKLGIPYSENLDTRISITPSDIETNPWAVKWQMNDEVIAVSANYLTSKLTMDFFDEEYSTFDGSVYSETYRIFYPSSI